MSIADFYIDNGIDAEDPGSMDAFLGGLERGHQDGAWQRKGQQFMQEYDRECDEEDQMMCYEQAKEEARSRLADEHPELSRNENIDQAESWAREHWRDYAKGGCIQLERKRAWDEQQQLRRHGDDAAKKRTQKGGARGVKKPSQETGAPGKASSCSCGAAHAAACQQGCCGKCCTGPCSRHKR